MLETAGGKLYLVAGTATFYIRSKARTARLEENWIRDNFRLSVGNFQPEDVDELITMNG